MVSGIFLLTIFLMVAAPGPSFVVLVNQSLRFGRVAGLMTVLGSTTGLLFWAVTSTLGLAVLLRTSEVVFVVFKLAGALYLCWLGISSFWKKSSLVQLDDERELHGPAGARGAASPWRSYRAGVVTSLANPKIATVYLAVMPQFLPAGGGTLGDVIQLTSVQISISAGWYLLLVLLIEVARRLLARPGIRVWLPRLSGGVLIFLGLHTAVMSHSII